MEKKIDARRGAWEIEKSFLSSLDAPQTHKILPINHGANTEMGLGTSLQDGYVQDRENVLTGEIQTWHKKRAVKEMQTGSFSFFSRRRTFSQISRVLTLFSRPPHYLRAWDRLL